MSEPAPSPEVLRLMAQVRAMYDAMQAFDQAVARTLGVNRTELQCLNMLEHGAVRAGALAAETGLTSGAMTTLLDRLESKGLTRRRKATEDRRAVEVTLTPGGRRRIGGIYRGVFEDLAAAASRHGDLESAAALLAALNAVYAAAAAKLTQAG